MPKCDFNKVAGNFIEIALWHGCSSVNLLHIFRAPFSKNTSERLLLIYLNENYPQCKTALCNSLEILRQILNFSTNLVLKAKAFAPQSKNIYFFLDLSFRHFLLLS